jgi:hypothetical protein
MMKTTRADQTGWTDTTATPVQELVLRVLRGKWQGQVIRLQAQRCTFGSAPQATLRLNMPGVAPQVCEIQRQGDQAWLRSFTPDTLVNGQPVTTTQLHAHDQLTVAGLELEIVSGVAASLPWSSGQDLSWGASPTLTTNEASPESAPFCDKPRPAKNPPEKRVNREQATPAKSKPRSTGRSSANSKLRNELRRKRNQLREQGRTLQKQQKSFNKQAAKQQRLRELLTQRKALLLEKQQQLKATRERLKSEAQELLKAQRQLQKGQQQQQELTHKLETQAAELRKREIALQESEARYQQTETKLQLDRQTLAQLQQELTQTALRQQQAETELQAAQSKLNTTQREWQAKYSTEHAQLEQQRLELQAGERELATKQAACEQRAAELQAVAQRLEQQQSDVSGQELTVQQQLAELNAIRRDFAEQKRDWDVNYANQEQALLAVRKDLETRELQLDEYRAELTAQQQKFERDQAELEHSTAEVLQERTRLEALEQQLLAQATTLEQEQTELHTARERFQEQREALEQLLVQERDTLATDRAHHQVSALELQRERAAWQKCKSQAEHELQIKQQQSEQQVRDLDLRAEEIRIASHKLTQHEQQLQIAKDDLQQRRIAAEAAVKTLHDQQSAWTQQQKEWERREAEYIAEQRRLDQARTAWQAEREKWEKQQANLQEERQKLAREKSDIEHERKSVSQERAEWDRIRASQLAQATLMANLPSPEEIQRRENALNQQAHELTGWRDQLRSQQQEHDQRIAETQRELATAREEIDRIERERQQLHQLQSTQQAERERLTALQSELDELRRLLYGQRTDLETRAQEIVQRESELLPREDFLRQQAESIAQREASLAMERASFEIQRVRIAEQTRKLQAEQADQARRTLPNDEQSVALQQAWDDLQREREIIDQKRTAVETERLQQQAAAEVAAIEAAQRAIPQATSLIDTAQFEEYHQLEADFAELQHQHRVTLQNVQELEQTLTNERQEFATARTNWEQTTTEQTTAVTTPLPYAQWDSERSELQATIDRQASELQDLQAQLDELQHSIEQLREANQVTDTEQQVAAVADTTDSDEQEETTDDVPTNKSQQDDAIFDRLRRLSILKTDTPESSTSTLSLYSDSTTDEKPAEETDTETEELSNTTQIESVDADEVDSTEEETPLEQLQPVRTPTMVGPANEREPAHPKQSHKSAGDDEEDSIDDYMARLLQRMRGGAASEVTASMHKPTAAAYQQANEEKAQVKARADEEAAKTAKPKREYVHTPAPEKTANLAAMRELANSTARSAVQTSRSKQVATQALNKVIVGGGGLLISALVLMFSDENNTMYRMGGMLGVLLSLGWLLYALYQSRHILLKDFVLSPPKPSRKTKWEAVPDETPAVEPAATDDIDSEPAKV